MTIADLLAALGMDGVGVVRTGLARVRLHGERAVVEGWSGTVKERLDEIESYFSFHGLDGLDVVEMAGLARKAYLGAQREDVEARLAEALEEPIAGMECLRALAKASASSRAELERTPREAPAQAVGQRGEATR